eukprot:228143-Chlamydomonas_euryale.AAC.3
MTGHPVIAATAARLLRQGGGSGGSSGCGGRIAISACAAEVSDSLRSPSVSSTSTSSTSTCSRHADLPQGAASCAAGRPAAWAPLSAQPHGVLGRGSMSSQWAHGRSGGRRLACARLNAGSAWMCLSESSIGIRQLSYGQPVPQTHPEVGASFHAQTHPEVGASVHTRTQSGRGWRGCRMLANSEGFFC